MVTIMGHQLVRFVEHPDARIGKDELAGQADWIEPSGCLRTFPYELKLDSPEWSGMDGFFAARLIRAG